MPRFPGGDRVDRVSHRLGGDARRHERHTEPERRRRDGGHALEGTDLDQLFEDAEGGVEGSTLVAEDS